MKRCPPQANVLLCIKGCTCHQSQQICFCAKKSSKDQRIRTYRALTHICQRTASSFGHKTCFGARHKFFSLYSNVSLGQTAAATPAMSVMTSTNQDTAKTWQRYANRPEPPVPKTGSTKETEELLGTQTPRTIRASTLDERRTSIFGRTSYLDFLIKYKQFYVLGQGGFGSVFAGRRLVDKLPVAIKRIPQSNVKMQPVVFNGRSYKIPLEVLMMMKAGGEPELVGQSAAVSILDWYNLEKEIILVMERPVTAVDLLQYINNNGPLGEDMAKVIMKQLVEAAIKMHAAGVFHRDIKTENILLERCTDGPRVRVIDFGCAHTSKNLNSSYSSFSGTPAYAPPEFYRAGSYKAGPTTVWQLAALLYEMLDGFSNFNTYSFLHREFGISSKLSTPCQDFLNMCLTLEPKDRATLEQMLQHPWLMNAASTTAIPPPHHRTTCCSSPLTSYMTSSL